MKIEDSKAIITVSTSVSTACPFYCRRGVQMGGEGFQDGINHLISEHGCMLLHVGTESSRDHDDKQWYGIVAVLGSPTALPEPPKIEINIMRG